MKIAQVVPAVALGGVWRQLQNLQPLAARGFNSVIVSLFDLDDEMALAVLPHQVIRLRLRPENYRDEAEIRSALAGVFRELQPGLVHSHHFYTDIYALPCAEALGIDALRSIHGITQVPANDIFRRDQIKIDWSAAEIERELALERYCSLSLPVSNDLRRKLLDYGFDSTKLETLYPGVDLNAAVDGPCRSGKFDADRCFEVGFVGRLEPVKNPFAVLDLARRCAQDSLPVKFTMVGEGRLLSAVTEAIGTQELAERVALLPATVNVMTTMRRFEALILPSYSEGLPLVMLEAMASGIPVLASNVGGVPEVIAHGENGFLFNPDDLGEMRRLLELLMLDDALRSKVADKARATVSSRFALSAHVDRLASIYGRWMR